MSDLARAARRLGRAVLACAISAVLVAPPVHAEPPVPVRPIVVRWAGHAPSVSFDAADFVSPEVTRKLESGLPQTLVTRVYAYPEGGKKPLALALRSCRIVYDLWDERYRVQIQRENEDRSFTTRDRSVAVQACTAAKDFALGDAFREHRGERIYFAVLLELNPLSPATVQRMRRWLSKQSAQELDGDAFFGSFVSIFVTRSMGSAERTTSFRSATHLVPP